MKHFALFAFCALLFTGSYKVRAQVQASLVSQDASVQPGRPFTVALRLVHQPHWHSYWVYPGTGLPTTLTWTLPAGWKASEIQWPTPGLLIDSQNTVVGNVFEGDLLLPVTLTPPADLKAGTPVTLTAKSDWLMCKDSCVPGNADLSLTLPVSSDTPALDPAFGDRIKSVIAQLPKPIDGWNVSASRDAKNVTLVLSGPAGAKIPKALHFYSPDGYIAFDQPQTVAPRENGFAITLPIGTDGPAAAPAHLVGVLAAKEGWEPNGAQTGFQIDTGFGGTAPVAAAPTAPASSPGAAGFATTLVLAMFGGLILNLMPCVFPVIGIKILGFVKHAGSDRSKVTAHGLIFTSGVLLSFWTLAAALAILRSGGEKLGWGFQLQSPPLRIRASGRDARFRAQYERGI